MSASPVDFPEYLRRFINDPITIPVRGGDVRTVVLRPAIELDAEHEEARTKAHLARRQRDAFVHVDAATLDRLHAHAEASNPQEPQARWRRTLAGLKAHARHDGAWDTLGEQRTNAELLPLLEADVRQASENIADQQLARAVCLSQLASSVRFPGSASLTIAAASLQRSIGKRLWDAELDGADLPAANFMQEAVAMVQSQPALGRYDTEGPSQR